jgi:hypothetical protein
MRILRKLKKKKTKNIFEALEEKLEKSDSLVGMEYEDIFNKLNEIFVKYNTANLKLLTLKDFEDERDLLDGCIQSFLIIYCLYTGEEYQSATLNYGKIARKYKLFNWLVYETARKYCQDLFKENGEELVEMDKNGDFVFQKIIQA